MEILITIKDKKIRLAILKKNKELDFLEIEDERSLAERLLPEIDSLLKRNKLASRDIKKMKVESDQGDSFTTTRIARSAAAAWNFAASA